MPSSLAVYDWPVGVVMCALSPSVLNVNMRPLSEMPSCLTIRHEPEKGNEPGGALATRS